MWFSPAALKFQTPLPQQWKPEGQRMNSLMLTLIRFSQGEQESSAHSGGSVMAAVQQ